eukprot:g1671.t1
MGTEHSVMHDIQIGETKDRVPNPMGRINGEAYEDRAFRQKTANVLLCSKDGTVRDFSKLKHANKYGNVPPSRMFHNYYNFAPQKGTLSNNILKKTYISRLDRRAIPHLDRRAYRKPRPEGMHGAMSPISDSVGVLVDSKTPSTPSPQRRLRKIGTEFASLEKTETTEAEIPEAAEAEEKAPLPEESKVKKPPPPIPEKIRKIKAPKLRTPLRPEDGYLKMQSLKERKKWPKKILATFPPRGVLMERPKGSGEEWRTVFVEMVGSSAIKVFEWDKNQHTEATLSYIDEPGEDIDASTLHGALLYTLLILQTHLSS